MSEPRKQQLRQWPEGRELKAEESIELSCVACQTRWRIQDRLRGFRLRCACGAWLSIPAKAPDHAVAALPAGIPDPEMPVTINASRSQLDRRGMIMMPGDERDGDVIYTEVPVNAPMAPGSMRRASNTNRQRWNNRTTLEFALLMAALLTPQIVVWLITAGQEFELLLPFASLASGALVALVIGWAGPYGTMGIRLARPTFFVEAAAIAAVSVGAATLYAKGLEAVLPAADKGMTSLVQKLGLPAALFVIAATPAVLEELIFRGLIQGRLMALFGRFQGLFVTAAAFAIVHGAPAVLPIHLSLGLYLGWLRERSNSLLPCMLMHFLYNGALVWLET